MRSESAIVLTKEAGNLSGHRTPSCLKCRRARVRAVLNRYVVSTLFCLLPGMHLAHAQTVKGRTQNPHGTLTMACRNCHTEVSWNHIRPHPDFNHNKTAFPIRGMHAGVDCRQCHQNLVFTKVGTKCADCHADIHRRQFGAECDQCHSLRGWNVTLQSINGHQNRFPLMGAHGTLDCQSCHKGEAVGQYVGLSTACASCHTRDFQTAKAPVHSGPAFSMTCENCHGMDSWMGARFNHTLTSFSLTGAHTTVSCAQCHKNNVYQGLSTTCVTCHLSDYNNTTALSHVAAGFPQDCTMCHNTTSWLGAIFNHTTGTKFPLTGAHSAVVCAQCHKSNVYLGMSTACVTCHLTDFNGTNDPSHPAAGLSQDCTQCHTTANWQGATFNHTTSTKFPLTGAHGTVTDCVQCHKNNVYAGLSVACITCHLADFNGTNDPNHPAAGLSQDCTQCHTTANWLGAKFNHANTKFPLTGAHGPVDCAQCHKNNVFAGLSAACITCHQTDFNGTTNPNHVAAGFPQDCSICHSTTTWLQAVTFNHSTTKFPLTGAHSPLDCAQCHKNNVFAGLSTACFTCHQTDFNGTTNPNHVAAGFPQDCSICHSTTNWQGANFNHSTTKFPLTGMHTTATCAQCHKNNVYVGLSTACITCHQTEFNGTTSPNHVAAGFPQDCSLCHSTASWAGATFNHNSTPFPLTGMHATATCAQCHKNNVYVGLSTACIACHQTEFTGTTNPNHPAAGFPQDCSLCHSTANWTSATFNHNTTPFPLTGTHATVACAQCHANNVYVGLSTACYSCHQASYTGTTNPNHAAAGFPQDCSLCHSTINWTGAIFNHNSTPFPLTGFHASVACSQCHASGVYVGLSTACYSCHQATYNGTTNPNHVSAGFPQDCSLCHSTTNWTGATFNHSSTPFPLTGYHTTVPCASCHIGGKYVGTPTDCYSCHSAEYKSTTNPNHTAAGFPTTCGTCHTTTAWTGATFNHTYFPISHGNSGSVCSVCHTNSADYSVFQCTGCHSKTQTDANHSGNKNYVYNSANCYQCHPNGSGG